MTKVNPVKVYRGDHLESTHDFHAAVVDKNGKLIYSYGNPERNTFARSSMKPFQAIPLIETGAAEHFNYGAREIAISCASHSGEDFHRNTVQEVLDKIGLGVNDLQCGMHPPKNEEDYKELLRSGGDLNELYSNCSGKHSGMLATAVHMNEDYKTYREIDNPVQKRIVQAISEVCETPVEDIQLSVDGCGVPVHRLPMNKTAYGYAQLAAGQFNKYPERSKTLQTIRDAMMEYPEMVAGTDRFDTDFMKMFPGKVVSKGGAEGVQCFGLVEEGLGFTIKCEDGNPRALSAITLKILEDLGFVPEELKTTALYKKYRVPTVKNMRKDDIGNIEVDFELKKED